ncbi:MAG: D-2-hydroxyacid dehydrogenase [Bacteroidaceae bacterium]|nr:D-2-hydroxyacid dehydrogenase [Bacteroidaceae bacterium]
MKAVILDAYTTIVNDDSLWNPLRQIAKTTVFHRTERNEIVERCKDAEIIITNKVVIDAEIISQLPHLRYIGVLATGYNVIDTETAKQHGIVVANVPAYSTMSVAQMVWAHILNITNRVGYYAEENKNGRWTNSKDFCYYDFTHHELAGKTFGVVGLGNTGMAAAQIAIAFGMNVNAYTSKKTLPKGIRSVSFDELFSQSDIISLHCPLTPQTKELINKDSLAKMKSSAIVINTSRGPVVNEADVADALKNGRIAAFAADVVSSEPPSADTPLLSAPNCFLTPHIAWATKEARERLIDITIANVKAFANGHPINQVNL